MKTQFKKGDRLKCISRSGLMGYEIGKQFKIGKIYTVETVKDAGGLIFEEIEHTTNIFGRLQGIIPISAKGIHRFKKVN